MDELKWCPFCPGKAEVMGTAYYWVRCKGCGAETKGSHKRAKAIAQWNERFDGGEIEYDYEAEG
jgi:hypothetical protein